MTTATRCNRCNGMLSVGMMDGDLECITCGNVVYLNREPLTVTPFSGLLTETEAQIQARNPLVVAAVMERTEAGMDYSDAVGDVMVLFGLSRRQVYRICERARR